MNRDFHTRNYGMQCSDLSDPWPMPLTELPLTRAQKRKARNANIIRYGTILAGLALLAFLYVRGV